MEPVYGAGRMSESPSAAAHLQRTQDVLAGLDPEPVDRLVDVLAAAWRRGSTIYTFGNGGSASTAQHLACDLFKCTIRPDRPRVRVLCLNDNLPLVSALTNDDGWSAVYVEQLRTWWQPGDVAFGISVHGGVGADKAGAWSQNVVAALQFATEHGGHAVGMAGFDGGVMRTLCDPCVVVPADSTPYTEGLHVVLHHWIAAGLVERIEAEPSP